MDPYSTGEKHPEDRLADKGAMDVAAQLTAGSDTTVDPQKALGLR